jgi:soluble lytic murein transglycosylase-like protein
MRKIILPIFWLTFSQMAWSMDLPLVAVPAAGEAARRVADWAEFYEDDNWTIERWFSQTAIITQMGAILKSYGLPEELVCLSMAESGLRANAISKKGAVGWWQFIPETGRRHGLMINRRVDERTDLIKSTRAAARYLVDLYAMFGNWPMALAAYNAGENSFNGDQNFWRLNRYRLDPETYDHVPRVLAIIQIARNRGLLTGEYAPNPAYFSKEDASARRLQRSRPAEIKKDLAARQELLKKIRNRKRRY